VAATVNSGDSIIFVKSQATFMTVIGAGAQGNRDNTIYLGRSLDSVVIAPPAGGTNSFAGLTIGAGLFARSAINLPQNVPTAASGNPPVNGDIWRDYSDNLWYRGSGNSYQLNAMYMNTSLGNIFVSPYAGSSSASGSNNIMVGYSCGQSITSGGNNTLLGAYA